MKDYFGEDIQIGDVFLDMCDDLEPKYLPPRFDLHVMDCDYGDNYAHGEGKIPLSFGADFASKYCVKIGRL